MPFGLKNSLSEFQNVMNDIFNPYMNFTIVYMDDVLIFSKNTEQHWKHMQFFKKEEEAGLVGLVIKIKLFQTKVRFLGHNIHQSLIISIDRAIAFAKI